MRTRTGLVVLLAACLAGGVFGCAPGTGPDRGAAADFGIKAPPMTVSDFYGFCSTAETPDGCFSDPVCNAFREKLAKAPRELAGCLEICRGLGNDLYVKELTNGCEHILERAQDYCDQFCRRRDPS